MHELIHQWQVFKQLIRSAFKDLLPIVITILVFQLGVFETVPKNWQNIVIGLIIVGIGLAIFLHGLDLGIFPVGESLATEFSKHGSRTLLLSFSFLIGYGSTLAEPALAVIAEKATIISHGRIDDFWLRQLVAVAVGFAVSLGVLRILLGHPIHYYIIAGYLIAISITYITPYEMIALSYDLGGVTTSTVTVPLVASLGIGLATNIKGRNPVIDGFGLIAFAALAPMIFVQFYGIFAYNFVETKEIVAQLPQVVNEPFVWSEASLLAGILNSLASILPVLATVLFFHYVILRRSVANISRVCFGLVLTVVGLYAFVVGLEIGLFSLGESMAGQLNKTGNVNMIYLFAIAIGFSTTMAEPALIAIANKAKEISSGKINDSLLRTFVAAGVAMGICLGCYRIVHGDPLQYYIMAGYFVIVVLTFFAPKYIIPVAYDSGAVTTSTVTVPIVAALGIGLATEIPGRSPLIDGFGLIAFASLFPMLTVLIYGIIVSRLNISGQPSYLDEIVSASPAYKQAIQKEAKEHLLRNEKGKFIKLKTNFEAIMVIVEETEVREIMNLAKNAGVSGVTVLDASGLGLHQFDNYYRYIKHLDRKLLLFLAPRKIALRLVGQIHSKLHGNADEKKTGIVMSFDISSLRGLGIKQELLKHL